jgi:hypothetical protein
MALALAFASMSMAADAQLGARAGDPIVTAAAEPESWGTAVDSAKVIGAADLMPPADTVVYTTTVSATNGIGIAQTGGPAGINWWYQFQVPTGALLTRVELEACDTNAAGEIQFGLASGAAPGGSSANISAIVGTGATPGCAFFPVTPTSTTTISNATNNYWIFFLYSGTLAQTTSIHAFRVYYRLQVAPAPATATFPNDVPASHPLFRFVEAMARTGITGGCGTGAYCPDAPLTRGQMAVFIATALGLNNLP